MGAGSGACAALPLVALVSLILTLQPTSTLAQAPGLQQPPNSNICENLTCGKGSCNFSSNSTESSQGYSYSYSYSYSSNDSSGCQCKSGWKTYDSQYPYLACVIPNCTFSPSCPQNFTNQKLKDLPKFSFNMTVDPCLWAICGEGTCKNTSSFSYICECKTGYKNILDDNSFPCFKDCEGGVGESCKALGIGANAIAASGSGGEKDPGSLAGSVTAPVSLTGSLFIMMASLLALA